MGLERDREVRRLCEADQHITDAETRVSKQIAPLDELRRDGHDTSEAEATLKSFQAMLQSMCEHRDQIVQIIAQIDEGFA